MCSVFSQRRSSLEGTWAVTKILVPVEYEPYPGQIVPAKSCGLVILKPSYYFGNQGEEKEVVPEQ